MNDGRRFTQWALLVAVIGLLRLLGCATPPSSEDDPIVPGTIANDTALSLDAADCLPLPAASLPGGSFTVALLDSVRPGQAPVPANSAERVVFAQLYETLVKVGCDGGIQGGLAEHWTCTEDSTTWVFRIRDGAVFWDGTRVTADKVKTAWIRNRSLPAASDHISPLAWMDARSKSVRVLDGRRLSIQLPEPQCDFPLLLAHPATAVSLPRPGWVWPVGSGPCRLQASTPAPLPDLNSTPNIHHPQPPSWRNLRFLVKPGLDARDLVVFEPDLLVVDDNDSADFFRSAPGFLVSPLPWQRLYLLVCSPRQNSLGCDRWRRPLAQLNCTTDLSGIATLPWHHLVYPAPGSLACPQLTGPIPQSRLGRGEDIETSLFPNENTLLFAQNDPGSRELAMRIAALGDPAIKVQGTSCAQMNNALEHQLPGAFILAMDRHYPSGCLQLASLLGRAAWLQKAAMSNLDSGLPVDLKAVGKTSFTASSSPTDALTQAGIITPVLLTRSFLVHKGPLAGIKLGFDGTLLLSGLGQAPTDNAPDQAAP